MAFRSKLITILPIKFKHEFSVILLELPVADGAPFLQQGTQSCFRWRSDMGRRISFICMHQWLVCNVFIWCQISIVGANKELDQNQWQHSQTELIKIFSSCQSQTRFYFFISAEKEKQLPIQWYKIAILCFIMNILTKHFYIVYSSAHFQMIS